MPSRTRAQPSALVTDIATMHAWYALRDELLDRIDNVEDVTAGIGRRIDATDDRIEAALLSADRAVDGNSTTVSEVRALISTSVSLENRFASFEAELKALRNRDHTDVHEHLRHAEKRIVARAIDHASKEQAATIESIKGLLMDFRQDLAATHRNMEHRFLETDNALRRNETALQGTRVQLTSLESRVTSMSQEIQNLQSHLTETRIAFKELESSVKSQCDATKADLRDFVRQEMHTQMVSTESKINAATGDALWRKIDGRLSGLNQELTSQLSSASDRLTNRCLILEERHNTALEGIESLGARLGDVKTSVDECSLTTRLHGDALSTLRRDVQTSVTQQQNHYDQLVGSIADQRHAVATRHDELRSAIEAASQQNSRTEFNVNARYDKLTQDMDQLHANLSTAFDQRLAVLTNDVGAIQRESDLRHRKLVESTHQALDRLSMSSSDVTTVAALRQDLGALRESVQTNSVAIERWRVDATALAEIKDWLQDLERRAASKSELEQVAAALTSSVAACRDAAHNSEAILAQRIEAERSAREYEATSIRSLLQRYQTSRGLASP